jgi:glycosyltransferase involved in cell wall biosynthesis
LKLLQINTVVNSGSTGRIAEDIGQIFLAEGHESYIAYGRKDRPSQSQLIKIGSQKDVLLHGAISAVFDRHGFGSAKATRQLVREIEALQPDFIALHNLHGYYLNIEVLFEYLQTTTVPVLWTLFDCWAFTGHCTYFDDIDCQKWITACHSCPKKGRYPKSFVFDNSKRNFIDKKRLFTSLPNLQLLVHSRWLRDLVQRSFLGDLPVHCMPTGVDTGLFQPQEGQLPASFPDLGNRKMVLGVANVWDRRKGLADFLQLAATLPADYQIVLVGLKQREIDQLPPNVIGIARTESVQELAQLYSRADVFVNPTYMDNFPTVNLEALACGTPVVTYETGGSPEAVSAQTGRVVAKGDQAALQQAIEAVCRQDREELRRKCRAYALQHFDKRSCYRAYLDLCESILQRKAVAKPV